MKKGILIFTCLLAAGLAAWHLWPEYGSGYSEDQRRLWNERCSLYPVWMQDEGEPRRGDEIAGMIGKTVQETESLLKAKQEMKEGLDRELKENRDKSGPEYTAVEPLSVDASRLPLYGLTEKEIAGRALDGDGDACLKMVQYLCRNTGRRGVLKLSWREKHDVGKWLDRAVALKRPGAQFLKALFTEAWSFQNFKFKTDEKSQSGVSIIVGTGSEDLDPGTGYEMEKTPGYEEFAECLKSGDYYVYRTAFAFLLPGDLSRERKLIHKVLLQGARKGKVENQRDLALLCFEEGVFRENNLFPYTGVKQEMEIKELKWQKTMKSLPNSWQERIRAGLFFCGVLDAERTPTMKAYREATKYAREAALQGDLTGMYLWMRYGITCKERFSIREWSDILSYGRVLFEAGYAPYLKEVADEWWGRNILNSVMMNSYYSRKGYQALRKKNYLTERDIRREFSSKDSLEEVREKIQDFEMGGQLDWFLDMFLAGRDDFSGGLMTSSSKEVRNYLLKQTEEWAVAGDLNAMYRLAGIYEKGLGTPADTGRAYAWYRKAHETAAECPLFTVALPDSNGDPHLVVKMGMKHVARLKMAEMVLNYPDFPGRNEKETYDLVLESSRDSWQKNYCYPLLGQFHEKGIGRSVDRARAIEFYTKGKSRSKACREALDRLSSSDGAQKTEKK